MFAEMAVFCKPNQNLSLLSILLNSKHPTTGAPKRYIQEATTAQAKRASLGGQVAQKATVIEVTAC